ncbi:MAG: hypothetical protein O2804_03180 [Verrucomicrobia bacterium]|jgi:mRNA-degrading endonuclease RelE of RelBE toxin-antitoxin system|nr:hypothetical protein [Verrucomicrobiota bacterium]MDA1340318.1 hypothetical protein [Verrucomicrobiota bacterium]
MHFHPIGSKEFHLITHAQSAASSLDLTPTTRLLFSSMASFQIIFTPASSAEITQLPTPLQVEVLREFDVLTSDFLEKHPDRFGIVRRPDRTLYRYRAGEYRIYFEKTSPGLVIHRVLHKNSLKDFAFRSQLPLSEDEVLAENPKFWELINSSDSKKK